MTKHLPAGRIAECVGGVPGLEEQRHLGECAECRAEVARLESALGRFREAVRGWSDGQSERALARARAAAGRRPARVWFRWPVWAAMTLALALATAPVYRTVRDRQRAAQALADAQLLEQVDREISESVPSPMEPLAQLVSWDSASQDGSQDSAAESSPSNSQNGEVR
jgi:anti-sigma factor RsiW